MITTKLLFLPLLLAFAAVQPLETKGRFTTDAGKPAHLSDWKGKQVVFAMIYPRCTSACPLIVEKLRKLQKKLTEKGEAAEFVLVSLDAEDESATRLTQYRQHMGLDSPNWHFLFGADSDLRYLSNVVNIRYWKNPKTKDISHDNVILLIGKNGEIVRRLEGLDAELGALF